MDIPTVVQVVSTLGFPIAACCAMGWFVVTTTNKHREEVSKLHEQHAEEMKEVTVAINNNTLALQKVCDRLSA